MGTRTLVQLIASARQELGLFPVSASVQNASDQIDQQMVALINELGAELQEQHSWTALQTEWVITTSVIDTQNGSFTEGSNTITGLSDTSGIEADTWVVTGTGLVPSARVVSVDSGTQVTISEQTTSTEVATALTFAKDTYGLPTDFQSYIGDTWWDRTNRWQLLGPTSPQMDQFNRSGIVTTSPRRNWRQIGRPANAWRIWPAPGSTDPALTLVFEYNSLNWAGSVRTLGPAPSMVLDTDTCVFPDRVMISGLKKKFFDAKGMDTTMLTRAYERSLGTSMAQDGGAGKLSMSGPRRGAFLLNYWNIPDNGYGPR